MEYQKKNTQKPIGGMLFDPLILVQDILKRWMLILLAALVVGVGTYIRTDRQYTPQYSTTTTYVVAARSSSSTVYNSLSSTSNLASLFEKMLNSSLLRAAILEELDNTPFNGRISANVIASTNLINVTVTDTDPRTVFLVSQAIIDHHEELTSLVLDSTALEVLQAPTVPTWPINSSNAMGQMKRAMFITAAAVTALLGMLSFYSNTIRSEAEAVQRLNCDCLGELPHEKKYRTLRAKLLRRKVGVLITNPATSFRYVENVRKLRRRVERMMHGRKVVMITSLLENEGKSTVAANLALALAQKHGKVLLIDCDLRKPACHTLMEAENVSSQLSDVISGKLSLTDAVIRDKKSDLDLLLQLRAIRNSGDLIFSSTMRALLDLTRREYDYVVLDMPPMAEVSDAEGMMEFADASLLVVRQNIATAPALNKAVATLADGKAKLLGCVVNNVRSTGLLERRTYGYSYGYGYGRYNSKKHK